MDGFAEWVTAGASFGTFLIALAALWLAHKQIRRTREIAAYDAYEAFHHFALQYPEFGTGVFDFATASELDRRRYEYFVMSVLLTIERVLQLFPNEASWKAAVTDDVETHLAFIVSPHFTPLRANLDGKVITLIDEIVCSHEGRRAARE